ncbi:hypothetical protein JIN81_11165 [Haloferula rosea]|uniref:Uncharacterized protein n=2 Tax=Haloferula rosea TaxID=490093 RepID=A0A934VG01_9BACT|nr:hypothetical protein [Haloferula rosea]
MIEMTLTELACWVLGIVMILVVVGGWGSTWRSRKEERRSARYRAVCRLCLAVFRLDGRGSEHRCPECGAKTDRSGPTPLG